MMLLPALTPEEQACLQALQPDEQLQMFAARLRQRLIASLGAPASVSAGVCGEPRAMPAGDEPVIAIDTDLAAAWLDLRMGGQGGAAGRQMKDSRLADPFKTLIRRALAESVVNAGLADWPHAMQLRLDMGGQTGKADIFWNSAHAMDWARRVIREKT